MRRLVLAALAAAVLLIAGPESAAAPGSLASTASLDAVVVSNETDLVLDRSGRLRERVRLEVQILTPAGRDRFGTLVVGYDTFRRIRSMSGELLNGNGDSVRRLRRRDIEDHPASDGFSLYTDSRLQVAHLHHAVYPHTVVWTYEVDHDGLLNWPSWRPQTGRAPVLHAQLSVTIPEGTPFRFYPERVDIEPTTESSRGMQTYVWTGAFGEPVLEPFGPSRWDQLPAVHLSTDAFSMAGHAGSLASWSGLAAWYGALSAGRGDLPASARADVQALVMGIESPRERAEAVYRYVQQRTRYVSVQLGIGGWQPFSADYVHERRYGDCKALVNYLHALLREVGIASFPALIGVDRPDLDPDFPRNAFNHVVLYVPLGPEELWLEATSSTAPPGFLGSGSEDRWVLVVEEGGGHLRRTPAGEAAFNRQARTMEATLRADGVLEVSEQTQFGGQQLSRVRNALTTRSGRDREDWWLNQTSLSVEGLELDIDVVQGDVLGARYRVPRYAVRAGSRLFVRPNVAERWTRTPPSVAERTQPVHLGYRFHDIDAVRITLPTGFRIEALPEPVEIEMPFGRYAMSVQEDEGALVYHRELVVHEHRLPAEAYDDYRAFIEAVVRADDAQVALSR